MTSLWGSGGECHLGARGSDGWAKAFLTTPLLTSSGVLELGMNRLGAFAETVGSSKVVQVISGETNHH